MRNAPGRSHTRAIAAVLVCTLATSCWIRPRNITPRALTRSPDNRYTLALQVRTGALFSGPIDAYVKVNDAWPQAMLPGVGNVWTYTTTPLPAEDTHFHVQYEVEYDRQIPIFPGRARKRVPASGTLIFAIDSGFVKVAGGQFQLNSRAWFPFGVNYVPHYALPSQWQPHKWMGENFDQSVVEADLRALHELGVNCISIQASLTDTDHWPNLIKVLNLCQIHDIRVLLALPTLDPLHTDVERNPRGGWPAFKQLVETYSLDEHKAILAYDVAWEPKLGSYAGARRRYDGVWSRFLAREIGTVADAGTAFNRPPSTSQPGLAAGIVSHKLPARAVAGQTYMCEVVMRNLGDIEWDADDPAFRLGVIDEDRVDLTVDTPPNSNAVFSYSYQAPDQPGVHTIRLAMLKEGESWFGPWLEWDVEVVAAGGLAAVQGEAVYPPAVFGPTDTELSTDTQDLLVNAYRRCMDTETATRFGRLTRKIRDLDPNHLITCRQGYGGNGSIAVAGEYPLELYATAYHFDFLCPENYAFASTTDTNAILGPMSTLESYCRWASSGKPVVWAEAGYYRDVPVDATYLANQELYYRRFIDGMLSSQANGVLFWWYPGGNRVEPIGTTDYGITNEDGTLRPGAVEMRDRSSEAKGPRPTPGVSSVGSVDLLASAQGFPRTYRDHGAGALSAALAGARYVMQGDGSGGDSTAVTLVGGIPKYLWADITKVKLKVGSGPWFEIRDGMGYAVAKDQEIRVSAEIVNMGDRAWLAAPAGGPVPGSVAFVSQIIGGTASSAWIPANAPRMTKVEIPSSLVTTGLSADSQVEFRMNANMVHKVLGSVRVWLFVDG